ncbi:hypothetical protein [Ammoniphilus sp. YIM 78166]|uniref:hypothetical protein n=1 Tax=Ammoniphilus sp. YIM 78166 TaxID=1644106 RepID=UPI0010704279|nr:hypothetical protein [Ammoniphilus sp. YIM 78166]
MKRSMMIWGISAIVYLVAVIAGYSVYASKIPTPEQHQHENHGESTTSEVKPNVSYANGQITIELRDINNQVPELEISHEKWMHFILVSSDLKEYYHLHPAEKNHGVFTQEIHLPDDSYKVFVDIKPKGLQYRPEPIDLHVGQGHPEHHDHNLNVDTELTKTIHGQTVELTTPSFEANQKTILHFDLKEAKPEPYLGALGHVVILDEHGENYIHVHPVAEDKTEFETQFSTPGVYKLWAEFKFGEQVHVYPFVIEVR